MVNITIYKDTICLVKKVALTKLKDFLLFIVYEISKL